MKQVWKNDHKINDFLMMKKWEVLCVDFDSSVAPNEVFTFGLMRGIITLSAHFKHKDRRGHGLVAISQNKGNRIW